MNSHPHILILGGNSAQIHQISPLLPANFSTTFLAAEHQFIANDFSIIPQLILVIQENRDSKTLDSLKNYRAIYRDVPILFIAKNPDKKGIIEAFRLGASDYLLFPVEPEEFLEVLNKYAPEVVVSQVNKQVEQSSKKEEQRTKVSPSFIKSYDELVTFSGEPKPVDSDLSVCFFGKFAIWAKDKMLELLPGEKNNALLAYLLYLKDSTIHRERLMSRFWGSNSPSSARNSLNVAMHNLRRHLHSIFPYKNFFQYNNDKYSINPCLEIVTDTDGFKAHWQKGRMLELQHGLKQAVPVYQKASSFYKGDFLKDIHYDEWCEQERENLLETYLFILDKLGFYYLKNGAFEAAIENFRKMIEKDACLEDVHRKLIFSYYKLGLRDIAIRQYYRCMEILKKELKVEPSHSTKALFNIIIAEKVSALKDWEGQNLKLLV